MKPLELHRKYHWEDRPIAGPWLKASSGEWCPDLKSPFTAAEAIRWIEKVDDSPVCSDTVVIVLGRQLYVSRKENGDHQELAIDILPVLR